MVKSRRRHSAEFKTKVVLQMLEGNKTLSEISSENGIHPTQLTQWRRIFLERVPEIFSLSDKKAREEKDWKVREDELYKKIGQLQVELDWLKKKLNLSD
jgi:transposase-like protein